MTRQAHTIARQIFELTFRSEKMARQVLHDVPGYFDADFMRSLEEVLSRHCRDDQRLIIDRIELDLGNVGFSSTGKNMQDGILEQLERALGRYTKDSSATALSGGEDILELFLHYLQFGVYPWYYPPDRGELPEPRLIVAADENPGRFREGLNSMTQYKHALERLAAQFSDSFNMQLFKALFPDILTEITRANHMIMEIFLQQVCPKRDISQERLRVMVTRSLWLSLLNEGYRRETGVIAAEVIARLCREAMVPLADIKAKIPRQLVTQQALLDQADDYLRAAGDNPVPESRSRLEEYYINNAGLVLLWPFLEKFFGDLGLLSERKFRNEQACQRGLMLSHYLVSGGQHMEEHLLVLNKILLGWPVHSPSGRFPRPSDEEKEACTALLREVISDWPALKDTSPAGLREAFLKRNGKLTDEDYQWTLYFEKNSVDILLEKLPWPCQLIGLSWMNKPISVSW
jgi:hypothetical protein